MSRLNPYAAPFIQDYIPPESAIALAALKKGLSEHHEVEDLLGSLEGIRIGFRVRGAESLKLKLENNKLKEELKIHKKSSAILATRAVFEKTEKEITFLPGFATSGISPISQSRLEQSLGDPRKYPRYKVLKWEFDNIGLLRSHIENATQIGRWHHNNLNRNIECYQHLFHFQCAQIHNYLDDCCHNPKIILDEAVQACCPFQGAPGHPPGTALDFLVGLAAYLKMPYTIIPPE